MIEIYHNPRCSKSREGLQILDASGKEFTIIKYLEEPLSIEKLQHIINLLKIKPIDLIRKNETVWKENYKNKQLTNTRIIQLLVKHPNLIERPIVINGNKAVIGRPPISILEIL
jgi:arsenate reductase